MNVKVSVEKIEGIPAHNIIISLGDAKMEIGQLLMATDCKALEMAEEFWKERMESDRLQETASLYFYNIRDKGKMHPMEDKSSSKFLISELTFSELETAEFFSQIGEEKWTNHYRLFIDNRDNRFWTPRWKLGEY